jgi:hypothetical protein
MSPAGKPLEDKPSPAAAPSLTVPSPVASGSSAGTRAPASKPEVDANPGQALVLPALGPSHADRSNGLPAPRVPASSIAGEPLDKGIRLGTPSVSISPTDQQVRASDMPGRSPSSVGSANAAAPSQDPAVRQPQVDSYDEETYSCKPNDTFRAISQDFYRTDKYERALLLFNRNHPLATDAVRKDPPALQPGQPVYVPPARILEKYYASAITDLPAPPSSPGPSAGAETLPAIRPASTPAAPSIPANGTKLAVAKEKLYRVQGDGEMILEVARRTLGNGDRWPEIYRLNPKLDPSVLIPAGSEIRLPGDAHVDTLDKP